MKPVVGVFSHPDDEVFGPGGTLALFAKEGRDVYIISVTNGEAGQNSLTDGRDLGEVRREELKASAKILGVKEVFFLNYPDGKLSNSVYHEIAEKISTILEKLDPEIVLTMEQRGITGHLDHIAVSFITTYIFEKHPQIAELWYQCESEEAAKVFKKHFPDYFTYTPPGYPKSQIDKINEISSIWEEKKRAMQQHASQKEDMDRLLAVFEEQEKEEYFLIKTHTIQDTE
jgi:N-acetylglucosamine malate deacetylase 2